MLVATYYSGNYSHNRLMLYYTHHAVFTTQPTNQGDGLSEDGLSDVAIIIVIVVVVVVVVVAAVAILAIVCCLCFLRFRRNEKESLRMSTIR